MSSNIGIIIAREFNERVGKKSFVITTLLMPVLMLLLMAAPAAIMMLSTPDDTEIAVVDQSGIMMPELAARAADLDFVTLTATDQPLDSVIADDRYDAVIFVGQDIVENPSNAALYNRDAGSMEVEMLASNAIKKVVEDERLKAYSIENLSKILDEVNVDVHLSTLRIDESGNQESFSSGVSYGMGMVMTFVLYMFLLLYGQMVMTSIIEEKNNRVLELVVSSVKPMQLMMGKIIGVGLVAVVQVVIWGVLLCLMSAFLLPAILPADLSAQVAMASAGDMDLSSSFDPDMINALATFTSVGYIATMMGYMLMFLVGGFLFYASIFAAIGSAVDNIQDASQLQTFAVLPIILALVFSLAVVNDPNGTMSVWMSMIPFTSPMVMLARIPFGIPAWQIWVSAAILFASFVAMAWIAGKIYRIGIFMYGKKPSIADLVRWARYK